jgi:hypothetical protein
MGTIIIRRFIAITLALIVALGGTSSYAATKKPTPKPSVKTSAKAAPKVTKKAAVKKKVVAKKKPVAKKKVVYKRKRVKVAPSPKVAWPPKGFRANGEIYAKVPTSKELLGVLSANPRLSTQMKSCSKFACGAVQVASYPGCTWWEISATVSGPTSETDPTNISYGSLRTTVSPSKAKQIVTVLLVTTEPLKPKVVVGNINITCYHSPRTEAVPTTTYVSTYVVPSPTATIEPTPSPSPTTSS